MIRLSAFTAMAIALNMMENLLPLPLGVRFGLAHVVSLCVCELYGVKAMWGVNVLRVIVAGLLGGIIFSYPWMMSAGGVFCASCLLTFLHNREHSLIFIGILCALAHNIGQIIVLSFYVQSSAFVPYLAVMGICAIVTGSITGRLASTLLSRLT